MQPTEDWRRFHVVAFRKPVRREINEGNRLPPIGLPSDLASNLRFGASARRRNRPTAGGAPLIRPRMEYRFEIRLDRKIGQWDSSIERFS
jgi:hypothetical protein